MRFVITEDLYNELLDRYCIEKSTSHRTEKVRRLVTVIPSKGRSYQAYRLVNVVDEKNKKEFSLLKKECLQYAIDHFLGNKYPNSSSGELVEIEVSKKGLNDWFSKTKTKDQAKSIKKLDSLLLSAKYTHSAPLYHGTNTDTGSYDYYESKFTIEDREYMAIFSIKSMTEGKGEIARKRKIYHHHYLDTIKIKPTSSIPRTT